VGISGSIEISGVIQLAKKRKHLFTVMLIQITDNCDNFIAMNRPITLTLRSIMEN
jgi:hypothetical protein